MTNSRILNNVINFYHQSIQALHQLSPTEYHLISVLNRCLQVVAYPITATTAGSNNFTRQPLYRVFLLPSLFMVMTV